MTSQSTYSLPDKNGLAAPFAALHHVALVTNDMEATVAFYRDVLGSEVAMAHRVPRPDNARHYFITVAPNTVFAFFEFPEAELPAYEPPTMPKTGRALDHISFFVENEQQLDEWKQKLDGLGIDYTEMHNPGMVRAIFFPDPNNIVIEIMVELGDGMRFPIHADPEPAYQPPS
jgi:catechol 2,3-dioxygenase-like lactoylglutathione lyase family enzyme